MSAFQQILASCGIGSAELAIKLDEAFHPRGSNIHGVVIVRGGSVAQRIERVTVELCQYWNSGKQSGRLAERCLAISLAICPDDFQEYPFSFAVPDDALLTAGRGVTRDHDQSGFLTAAANIPWAVNPSTTTELNIVPHRELAAVWEAMRLLGFEDRARGDDDPWATTLPSTTFFSVMSRSAAIVKTFDPPPMHRGRIDHVTLKLLVEGGSLYGNWSLSFSPHSLTERINALVGGERQEVELKYPCGALRDKDGKPNPRGALPSLQRLIEQALEMPDAEKRTLLRGSDAPAIAPDTLLRPATAHGNHPSQEDLLRPSHTERPSH